MKTNRLLAMPLLVHQALPTQFASAAAEWKRSVPRIADIILFEWIRNSIAKHYDDLVERTGTAQPRYPSAIDPVSASAASPSARA